MINPHSSVYPNIWREKRGTDAPFREIEKEEDWNEKDYGKN